VTVQLALTPDGKWDVATFDLVSAASAAGFKAVGVNADRVDAAAVAAYADAGVHCHELLAFIVDNDESAMMASAEQLADRAQTIGAEWVLTVFTDKVPSKRIQRCAKLFDDAGAGIAVEYTPLGAIPTISDGMEYVSAAAQTARAGLMIDSWHFHFSTNTWEDLAAVPLDDIAYVQFTDALEPEYRERMIRESLHRRALPGDGILELNRLLQRFLTAAGRAPSASKCSARNCASYPSMS
jgi:sugar phosphate isomerase/epimerase